MYIFLGIIGELATVIGSSYIILNGALDSVLEISKNGYKIDKNTLDEFSKKQEKEKQDKNKGIKRLLGGIILFTPGVNLINSIIKINKLKKSVMSDPMIKESLIPMTDKEKEQYAKMEGKMQKLAFTAFTTKKGNNDEEFFGFVGNRPIVVDHGLTAIYCEELMPLDYTLDEVKRLNDATTYSYRIGKIEDKNVAIIGIPNPDSQVSRVQFKKENYSITHAYEKMTEEDAQDKTFVVYPFTTYYEEDVQKVIDEIKQSRTHSSVNTNLETLQVEPRFEQDYIQAINEEVQVEEQQGPVLKKTLMKK